MTSLSLAAEGLLDRGSSPALAIATLGYLRRAPAPTSSDGGGGGSSRHRWPSLSPEHQRAYREYARHLTAKKLRKDEDESRQLETAWNRIHGIEMPSPEELPAPVVEIVDRIKRTPPRRKLQREVLTDRLLAMLADLRIGILEDEARLDDEELDDIAVIALMAWP